MCIFTDGDRGSRVYERLIRARDGRDHPAFLFLQERYQQGAESRESREAERHGKHENERSLVLLQEIEAFPGV